MRAKTQLGDTEAQVFGYDTLRQLAKGIADDWKITSWLSVVCFRRRQGPVYLDISVTVYIPARTTYHFVLTEEDSMLHYGTDQGPVVNLWCGCGVVSYTKPLPATDL